MSFCVILVSPVDRFSHPFIIYLAINILNIFVIFTFLPVRGVIRMLFLSVLLFLVFSHIYCHFFASGKGLVVVVVIIFWSPVCKICPNY